MTTGLVPRFCCACVLGWCMTRSYHNALFVAGDALLNKCLGPGVGPRASVQSVKMVENGHILGVSQGLPGPGRPPELQWAVGTSPWGGPSLPDPSKGVVTRGRCLKACSPSKMSKMVTFWACPRVSRVHWGPQSSNGLWVPPPEVARACPTHQRGW